MSVRIPWLVNRRVRSGARSETCGCPDTRFAEKRIGVSGEGRCAGGKCEWGGRLNRRAASRCQGGGHGGEERRREEDCGDWKSRVLRFWSGRRLCRACNRGCPSPNRFTLAPATIRTSQNVCLRCGNTAGSSTILVSITGIRGGATAIGQDPKRDAANATFAYPAGYHRQRRGRAGESEDGEEQYRSPHP
jgi:hypothetical protein